MAQSIVHQLKYSPLTAPFWNLTAYPIAAGFYIWLRGIELTCRILVGQEEPYLGPAIYVNWHQQIPHLVSEHGKYGRWILCSRAPYMESIARWCAWAGLNLIRGASGENGKAALTLIADRIRTGGSVVLAVDGPGGPPFQVKRGCVEVSKATGAPIIPVSYHCRDGHMNKSRWDSSLRAKLFDEIYISYGKPIFAKDFRSDEKCLREVACAMHRV